MHSVNNMVEDRAYKCNDHRRPTFMHFFNYYLHSSVLNVFICMGKGIPSITYWCKTH